MDRPALPVTARDAAFNLDGSGAPVNAAARPKPTLDLSEILAVPEPRRGLLLWRFIGHAALRAGMAAGQSTGELPAGVSVERPGLRLSSDGNTVDIELDGERRQIDPRRVNGGDALFALQAFSRALIRDGETDAVAAQLYLPLFGPDGAFVRGGAEPLPADARFRTPKLLCWDFNGTVEQFGDGRTRPEMAGGAQTLRRRGAMSVLTTTIGPEKPEQFLEQHGVSFVSHYGRAEVRPTKGNKQYRGIAAEHGVSAARAPEVMAVFGDSRTDIPSDLPGVVFFHNDARTPAPAVERVLMELDRRGDGDLAAGLAELLGGLPPLGEKRSARVGPIELTVEMRDGGSPQEPCLIPTVHAVRVEFNAAALTNVLREVPPPTDLDARGEYRLGLEHLAAAMPLGDVAAVLSGVAGTPGEAASKAAVERRSSWNDVVTHGALDFLQKNATAWTHAPLSADAIVQELRALAGVESPAVARQLPALAQALINVGPDAERATLDSLDAFADQVRGLVGRARVTAPRFFPSSAPGDPKILRVLSRAVKNPVPLDAGARQRILDALTAAVATPVGDDATLAAITDGLDEALLAVRKSVSERFAERGARKDEILGAVAGAMSRADVAAAAWEHVGVALAAM